MPHTRQGPSPPLSQDSHPAKQFAAHLSMASESAVGLPVSLSNLWMRSIVTCRAKEQSKGECRKSAAATMDGYV